MSLVELMVGITVGLFVVGAAATLMASQLSDNRSLLIETQMQQDLRASMDIITRQLRRAGAVDLGRAQAGLALGTNGGSKSDFANVIPTVGADSKVEFTFYRNAAEAGPYGFKLESGVIKTQLAGAGWQDLTDANTLKVTTFTITPIVVTSAALPCPKLCADETASCWPTLVVRNYRVTLEAEAKTNPAVRRSITSAVRLRNDWVRFRPDGNLNACPA